MFAVKFSAKVKAAKPSGIILIKRQAISTNGVANQNLDRYFSLLLVCITCGYAS